jgi:hypothetical protein
MAKSVGMARSALTFGNGVKNGGNFVLLHHGRLVIVELVSTLSPPGCAEVTEVSIGGAGVLPLDSGTDTVDDMLKLVSPPLVESMVVLIPVLTSMLTPLLALSLLISLVRTAVEVPPDSTTDPTVVETGSALVVVAFLEYLISELESTLVFIIVELAEYLENSNELTDVMVPLKPRPCNILSTTLSQIR